MGNFIVRTSVLEQVYNGLLDIQKKSSALGEVDLPCSLATRLTTQRQQSPGVSRSTPQASRSNQPQC